MKEWKVVRMQYALDSQLLILNTNTFHLCYFQFWYVIVDYELLLVHYHLAELVFVVVFECDLLRLSFKVAWLLPSCLCLALLPTC